MKMNVTMKNYFFLTIVVFACLLGGCAPRVVSDMYTYEFAPLPPDSVQVFQAGEQVPPRSLAIGTVKVVDNGLSVKGSYDRVLQLAIGETARNGGNGLIVQEHLVPDRRSTIHRVWGTMLRMEQTAADTVTRASVQQALARSDYDGYVQYKENLQRAETLASKSPRNVFRASVGPSWLVSRFETPLREYKSKGGLDFAADYEHLWKWGFGIGVNYLHNYTTFNENITLRFNYIGPSLAMGYMLGSHWRIGAGAGVGYGWYKESGTFSWASHTESNIATLVRMSIEYMPTHDFGLGLQMNTMTMRLEKPDDFVLKDNEFYGIQSLGILAAVHFYF